MSFLQSPEGFIDLLRQAGHGGNSILIDPPQRDLHVKSSCRDLLQSDDDVAVTLIAALTKEDLIVGNEDTAPEGASEEEAVIS